jgi:hypothetical protein
MTAFPESAVTKDTGLGNSADQSDEFLTPAFRQFSGIGQAALWRRNQCRPVFRPVLNGGRISLSPLSASAPAQIVKPVRERAGIDPATYVPAARSLTRGQGRPWHHLQGEISWSPQGLPDLD